MPETSTGQTVRERRMALGMSRRSLAEAAGISQRTLFRFEMEGHVPNGKAIAALATVLELSVDDVLSGAA